MGGSPPRPPDQTTCHALGPSLLPLLRSPASPLSLHSQHFCPPLWLPGPLQTSAIHHPPPSLSSSCDFHTLSSSCHYPGPSIYPPSSLVAAPSPPSAPPKGEGLLQAGSELSLYCGCIGLLGCVLEGGNLDVGELGWSGPASQPASAGTRACRVRQGAVISSAHSPPAHEGSPVGPSISALLPSPRGGIPSNQPDSILGMPWAACPCPGHPLPRVAGMLPPGCLSPELLWGLPRPDSKHLGLSPREDVMGVPTTSLRQRQ